MTHTPSRFSIASVLTLCLLSVQFASHGVYAQEAVQPELAQASESGLTLDDRLAWIEREFEKARIESHTPGASLAVVFDDKVVLLKGFGVMNIESELPVTPQTRFAIGSTTKAFTAALIGMLADEGKMDYDEPASTHLHAFHLSDPEADAKVTIRDLLCHRTGFASMNGLWYGVDDIARDDIIKAMSRAMLLYPFRQQWHYSNVSFLAAGMAAGNAAGTDWDTLVRQRIFEPLGMKHANTTYAQAQADPQMAKGYMWNGSEKKLILQPMRNIDAAAPAGSINADAEDMAKWVRFQLGDGTFEGTTLLSKKMHDQAWQPQMKVSDDVQYGLGWMISKWDGKRLIEHAGGIDGFTAEVAMVPEKQLGIVVLTNANNSPLGQQGMQIVLRGMLTDVAADQAQNQAKDQAQNTPKPEAADDAAAQTQPEDFDRFIGDYIANFGPFKNTTMKVLVQDDTLAIDVPGQTIYALKAPDETGKRFFAITDTIALRFNEDDAGQVYSATMYQAGTAFDIFRKGAKVPIEIDLDKLQKYTGIYRQEEAAMDITVRITHNRLAIDVPGQVVFELYPPDADGEWVFRAIDAVKVRFNEDDAGKVVSMIQLQEGQEIIRPRIADLPSAVVATLPDAAQVIDWLKQAGMTDTEHAITSLAVAGQVRMPYQGLDGSFTVTYADDGRMNFAIDLGRFGSSHVVLGLDSGVSITDTVDTMELDDPERARTRLGNPLTLAQDWNQWCETISVVDTATFHEHESFVVELGLDAGAAAKMYLDVETHLPIGYETVSQSPLGALVPITVLLDDWQMVEGVLIAHKTIYDIAEGGTIEFVWQTAKPNVPIADAEFETDVNVDLKE